MTTIFSDDITRKFKALGIYQITGGIIGLGLTIWLISQQSTLPGLLLLLILIAIALYSFSIYCGIQLIKHKPNGLNRSLINQYLQLISFSLFGYAFQYYSGVYFSIGIDLTNDINFKINFGVSSWQININQETDVILINFNLVALFLIIFIDKLKKKVRLEEGVSSISEIAP